MKRLPFPLLFAATGFLLASCGPSDLYPNTSTAPSTEGEAAVYTITFDSLGGSAVAPLQVKGGAYASAPADPVFDGHAFRGWFVERECITVFDWERVAITADWTLYAGWEALDVPSSSSSGSSEEGPSGTDSTPSSSEEGPLTSMTVYFKDPAWWCADGAVTSIHYWDGAGKGTTWPGLLCTLVGERNVDGSGKELGGNLWSFELDLEAAKGGFMFVRHNPDPKSSGQSADWGAKTPDLHLGDMNGHNLYDAEHAAMVWGDPGVKGVWGDYRP